MSICQNCGATLGEGNKFCVKCGARCEEQVGPVKNYVSPFEMDTTIGTSNENFSQPVQPEYNYRVQQQGAPVSNQMQYNYGAPYGMNSVPTAPHINNGALASRNLTTMIVGVVMAVICLLLAFSPIFTVDYYFGEESFSSFGFIENALEGFDILDNLTNMSSINEKVIILYGIGLFLCIGPMITAIGLLVSIITMTNPAKKPKSTIAALGVLFTMFSQMIFYVGCRILIEEEVFRGASDMLEITGLGVVYILLSIASAVVLFIANGKATAAVPAAGQPVYYR